MQDMTDCIKRDWNHEFNSIEEQLGKFEDGWIFERGVDQAFKKLMEMKPSLGAPDAFRNEVSLIFSVTVGLLFPDLYYLYNLRFGYGWWGLARRDDIITLNQVGHVWLLVVHRRFH